jgi:RHS repeat-associated protein
MREGKPLMIRSFEKMRAGAAMLLASILMLAGTGEAKEAERVPTGIATNVGTDRSTMLLNSPMVPLAANPHQIQPLEHESDVEKLLSSVSLGSNIKSLKSRIGDPLFAGREAHHWYWTYEVDNHHAWLVVGSTNTGIIESLQVVARADTTSSMHDLRGFHFGDRANEKKLPDGTYTFPYDFGQPHQVTNVQRIKRFYGFGRYKQLERIGISTGDLTLPLYVRWHRYDGEGAARAIAFNAYSKIGEANYVRITPDRYIPCYGGNHWGIKDTRQFSYASVKLDEVHLQCGNTALWRTLYFNRTKEPVHGYDADPIAQQMFSGTASPSSTQSAVAAHELSTKSLTTARVSSTTGQIWFTTPYASHCTYNNSTCDLLLAYIDDPAHPLDSVTITPVLTPLPAGLHALHAKSLHVKPAILTTYSCGYGNSIAKCYPPPTITGSPGYSGSGDFGGNAASAGNTSVTSTNDPSNNPPSSQWHSNGSAGDPVDVVSGALWYQQDDFTLAGPDPLSFFHQYKSTLAQGAVSGGPAQRPPTDLGVGWRHTYDSYLDLSQQSSGFVALNQNDGGQVYFQTPAAGSSATSYDPNTGDELTTNTDGTFTLVTWSNQKMQFDANGFLSSLTDRIGNVQTIARNSDHTISSITGLLGRALSFSYDSSHRITGIASTPSGINVSFTYDTGTNCYTGQLCTAQESDGKTWTYEYYDPSSNNGFSLLKYVIDPLGHTKQYNQYSQINLGSGDNHYRVTNQERDSGHEARVFSYTYGTTSISDSLGASHTTNYTWDPLLQQVLSVTGPLCNCNGNRMQYKYDVVGRKVNIIEGTGAGVVTQHFTYGRDIIFTSPDGRTSYPTGIFPGPTKIDSNGLTTTSGTATSTTSFGYYALGDPRQDLPQTITEPSVDTPGNLVTTTNTFSTAGLLTGVSRQGYVNGTSTTYNISTAYDATGRITSTTGPRTDVTQTTTYGYYSDTDTDLARRGQLETITDPASHTTNFATAPSPYNSYTIYGAPKSSTDQNGVVTDFTYDARGKTLTSTLKGVVGDTADLTTTYTYDANGRVTSIVKPLGNGQTNVYDSNNNLTNTILTDSSGNQYDQIVGTFDTMDRLTAHTNQSCTTPAASCLAWSTQYSDAIGYTNLDQQQNVTYPTGGATSYTYDGAGNLSSQTIGDSAYSVTDKYVSDLQHQNIDHTLGASTLSSASDLQYNHALTAPSNASATTYQHDDFGRIEMRVSPFSGTTTFTYDPAGNLTSTTDGNGATTATTYDVLNRPLVATSTRTGLTTETVTNTYDDATSGHFGIGKIASMTDPSGSTTYTYERRGKIASTVQVANSTSYTTGYTYDGNGNRSTITLPSTRVLTYTYDYADRPKSVVSGTTTYVSSATYKPFGPLTQLVFGNGTTQTKSFNQRYLLTENKLVHGGTSLSDVSFAENATGFITGATDNLNSAYNQNFQYGGRATNMLTGATTGSGLWGTANYADTYNQNLSSINFPSDNYGLTYDRTGLLTSLYNNDTGTSQAVTYDAAGNELTVGTSNYTYSTRNHLSSGDGVSYTYDGMGRRVSATATAGTRTSLYDPEMHLQSESALSSGSVAYDYIWFAGIPVAQEDVGGNTHWTVTDYRNTPFMQTTSTGSVYWQVDYSPFGAVYAIRTSDVHQPIRMPGQEAEEFTTGNANGLTPRFYNGFRWYRPSLGRYTQVDPIDYSSDLFNLYGFANNNPINYYDSLGLDYASAFAGYGAIAGASVAAGSSVVVTAETGGINIIATPAEIAGGAVAGSAVGYAVGSLLDDLADFASNERGNRKSTEYQGVTDEELNEMYKNASGAERVKIQQEQKARAMRNKQKRGNNDNNGGNNNGSKNANGDNSSGGGKC